MKILIFGNFMIIDYFFQSFSFYFDHNWCFFLIFLLKPSKSTIIFSILVESLFYKRRSLFVFLFYLNFHYLILLYLSLSFFFTYHFTLYFFCFSFLLFFKIFIFIILTRRTHNKLNESAKNNERVINWLKHIEKILTCILKFDIN